jgi:hypothetical protein
MQRGTLRTNFYKKQYYTSLLRSRLGGLARDHLIESLDMAERLYLF